MKRLYRQYHGRIRKREGFEVDAVNHPQEALNRFKPGMYDMVMLDVRMPDIDGFTL
jgi:CheY-like chemotaxis protein